MVGIDIGTGTVSYSNGADSGDEAHDAPGDLRRRVADSLSYVALDGASAALSSPQALYARIAVAAFRNADEDSPGAIAIPGWWGPRVREELSDTLRHDGAKILVLDDAEAAVAGYLSSGATLPAIVAVVSLRARDSSVKIVCQTPAGARALPSPAPVLHEGGDDLDAVTLRHVVQGLRDLGDDIDAHDPEIIAAAHDALPTCRALREELSIDATVTMRPLPGIERSIRFVRSELEEIATPWVDRVVEITREAIDQVPASVGAILLVGGLAHMPLVSQRLSADLTLPVHIPEDPRIVVARGADILHVAASVPAEEESSGWRRWLRRTSRDKAPLPSPREAASLPRKNPVASEGEWSLDQVLPSEHRVESATR